MLQCFDSIIITILYLSVLLAYFEVHLTINLVYPTPLSLTPFGDYNVVSLSFSLFSLSISCPYWHAQQLH